MVRLTSMMKSLKPGARNAKQSRGFGSYCRPINGMLSAAIVLAMSNLPVLASEPLQTSSMSRSPNTTLLAQILPGTGAKPIAPTNMPTADSGKLLTTLRAAVQSQKVDFSVTGDGVTTSTMKLQVTNKTGQTLRLLIPQNEVFRANSANVQTMMVTKDTMLTVAPGAQIQVSLAALCASTKNMHPPPPGGVSFEIGNYPDKGTWDKLSRILAAAKDLDKTGAFNNVPLAAENRMHAIMQYAVWRLLGTTTGDPNDLLNKEAIASDWTKELNEKVKHDPKLYADLKDKGQLNAEGGVILDKKQKERLDNRVDLILEATDLTIRRSSDADLPGVASLPADSTWGNLDQVGVRAFQKGDYLEAQELLEGAVKEAEKFGETDARLATSLTNLSLCLIEEGLSKDAEPDLKRALKIREATSGKESIEYASVTGALGTIYILLDKPVDAEQYLQTTLNIRQAKLGADHTEVAEVLVDLGKLYCSQGKVDDAERLLKQALAIRYKAMGGDSAAVADINTDLGDVYKKQGKLPQAEKMYMKALAIDNKALGQDNAYNATILASLADVYKSMGKDKDAQTCTTTADAIKQKVLGGNTKLLALLPSNHETMIRVQTFATANESMEASMKEITATADPKLLAAAVAEKKARGSRTVKDKWALVIGISNYKDSSINLKCSAKDARDFADYLIKDAHFAPDHVRILTDEKATKQNILEAFGEKWLPRVAAPDDLVVFYFSGHGSPSQADKEGVNYLVAYDTDKNSLYATGIKIQDFTDQIKSRIHTDRMLLVMDACHSGAAEEKGAKGLFRVNNFSVDQIVQGSGQFVICSSQPSQVSWESKADVRKYNNGVFTHYLIEGLRKKQKLGEACEYMKDQVQREVLQDRGVLQDPVVGSHWEGEDLLVGIPPANPGPGLPEDQPMVAQPVETASKSAKGTPVKTTPAVKTGAKTGVASASKSTGAPSTVKKPATGK